MKSFTITLVVISAFSTTLAAQPPSFGTSGRPTTSPYLNLIPGRTFSPALNYYGTVRPQIDFRRGERRLDQSISELRREVEQPNIEGQKPSSYLGTTGHRTEFHSLGNYFPVRRRTR